MSNDQAFHQTHADEAEFVAIKQAIARVEAEAKATIAAEERAAAALALFALSGVVATAGMWSPAVASTPAPANPSATPESYRFGVATAPPPSNAVRGTRERALKLSYGLPAAPVSQR